MCDVHTDCTHLLVFCEIEIKPSQLRVKFETLLIASQGSQMSRGAG